MFLTNKLKDELFLAYEIKLRDIPEKDKIKLLIKLKKNNNSLFDEKKAKDFLKN